CTTICSDIGHFATNGLKMLCKLQLQLAKKPLGMRDVVENTTLVTTIAHPSHEKLADSNIPIPTIGWPKRSTNTNYNFLRGYLILIISCSAFLGLPSEVTYFHGWSLMG
ncbi:hypothetical protein AB4Z22_35710, partial [Paenibacillus sp. TAF58]